MHDPVMTAVMNPARLASLRAAGLLDTAPEEAFDRFTRLAAHLLRVPIALFSLVDERRQYFKSAFGLAEPLASERETPLTHSFCKHVVATGEPLLVEDARVHPVVCDNPAVAELGVLAYAGMPVTAPDGSVLGSFCAVDVKPHRWTEEDVARLRDLAAALTDEVKLRFDVAARRQAEEKLLAEREFVGQAFDIVDALMVVVGQDGSIRRVNRTCARLAGSEPQHLRGRDFVNTLVPQPNKAEVTTGLADLLAGRRAHLEWQGEWLGPDGTSRYVTWSAARMVDRRGRRYALVSGLDRTFRRRLEERFGSVLAAATENSIIGCDADGCIELFNPGAERMLGYAAAEVVGRRSFETLHDPRELERRALALGVAPGLEAVVASARRGSAETREWTYIRKDGARLTVMLSVSAIRDETGRIAGFIGIANDVTERRWAEDALRLVHWLTVMMASAEDFAGALEVALAEICHLTGWAYGEVWLPRTAESVLERSPIYYLSDPAAQPFVRAIEGMRFRMGEGLPGHVWATKAPFWVADLAAAGLGGRTELAVKAGVRVGVGVPVLAGDDVVAIIVFGHYEPKAEDERLVRLISTVASQLGSVVQRKLTEEAMQRQAVQLREQAALLELANDAIVVRSLEGVITYWNSGAERLYGWTRDEAVGQNIRELLHTQFPEPVEEIDAEFEATGRWEGELLHTTQDGRVITVSSRWTLQTDDDGNPVGVLAITNDVSERKEAEEALRESEERLQDFLENATDLVQSTSPDGHILYANRAWRETLGYSPDEIHGLRIFDVMAPDCRARCIENFQRVLAGESLSEVEVTFVTKTGREVLCSGSANCRMENGQPVATRGIFRDITARRQAELALQRAIQQAEEANRAKSDFLARMSHELRTPLNSVIGFTNILLKNKAGVLREQELTYLGRIAANGKHLLELINDILDLSKIEAGKIEILVGDTSLEELVAETVTHLPRPAEGVQLLTEVPPGLAPIGTDAPRLKQVLINLASNALKFTESGTVTIRVVADGPRPVRIEVEDTGIGIPPDRLDAIFDAFQQAETGTSRKYGGTGLGLAISRSLCDLLHCRLTVHSVLGAGSTFVVELPDDVVGRPANPSDATLTTHEATTD